MENVIQLGDKRKAAVKWVLQPQITVYEDGKVGGFCPNVSNEPAMHRNMINIFRSLADAMEAALMDDTDAGEATADGWQKYDQRADPVTNRTTHIYDGAKWVPVDDSAQE